MITLSNYAQNLVPNPSFELYDTCPYSASQIYFAVPWKGVTTNSTDYFNACSSTYTSVPRCGAGWQYARTGNAYALIYGMNGYGFNYREYLQVKLNSTLQPDSCYWVEYYCNNYNLSGSAINSMGAYISNSAVSSVGPGLVLQYSPQVVSQAMLSDTLNWMRVSGYYQAMGGEQYITIGNFNTDANTDTLSIGGPYHNVAYYLIDDVSITKIVGCDTLNSSLSVIEQKQDYRLKLYPNPSNGATTIEYHLAENDKAILTIYDITGKKLNEQFLNSKASKLLLDENTYPAGVYYYSVIVNDKSVQTEKIVIIK